MPSIRTTKTSSGATALQAVRYDNRKTIVLKHFGSAQTMAELSALRKDAEAWLERYMKQPSLFEPEKGSRIIHLGINQCLGVRYFCVYTILRKIVQRIGFDTLGNDLLLDLVIMQIVEPSSKLRTLELLNRYFDISYSRRTLYRALPTFSLCQEKIETLAVGFARKELRSDLSFVLYDVTTLYFESFDADDLRKPGFSKDSKSLQPQIVLGLLVNTEGFPLRYEIFSGNTFEGKTMLPVLRKFRDEKGMKLFSVVADAAMMALENLEALRQEGLTYIVGARVANLASHVMDAMTNGLKEHRDGDCVRIPTPHGDLVASFSSKRYRKDKKDMELHIKKATKLIAAKEPGKRAKFVKTSGGNYAMNHLLIAKTTRLLGIKGYYTNIPKSTLGDAGIIAQYKNLWRVEQSFRMSKSDLVARPMYHHKENSIKAHLAICFMALAVGKYLELKTGFSLRRVIDLLKQVQDARILNIQTKEEILIRAAVPEKVEELFRKLSVSY